MAESVSPIPDAAVHAEHHGSIWPFVLTIGTTIFLLGALKPVLAIPGLLVMLTSVALWIKEDVHELRGKPLGTGTSEYFWGTMVLILSEIILFGLLFAFYFWARSYAPEWPAPQLAHLDLTLIYANTVILLSSGFTAHMAEHALAHGKMRKFRGWLITTIALGSIFLVGQAHEYLELFAAGLDPTTNPFGTAFFSLTGVHGLHVLAGVLVLSIILALSYTGFITKERATGVKGAFYYWHFVDVVWIAVFLVVYLRVV